VKFINERDIALNAKIQINPSSSNTDLQILTRAQGEKIRKVIKGGNNVVRDISILPTKKGGALHRLLSNLWSLAQNAVAPIVQWRHISNFLKQKVPVNRMRERPEAVSRLLVCWDVEHWTESKMESGSKPTPIIAKQAGTNPGRVLPGRESWSPARRAK
jgi:hypothetical protein